ncbi:hypothetical protein [Tateyamaria sp. syn59]|uniref:hypothetical protein n=1 Tax=Tateyamaria sp. syn59 TaxID=2576942 RepID=UPI0011BEF81F|nr:hypothetical protein [Tateyamaria sp. syn59]
MLSAAAGAGFAGVFLADGFGRARWRGQVLGLVSAIAATVMGALVGSAIALSVAAATVPNATVIEALEIVPLFGFVAILDGLTNSVPVAVTWALSMAAVQMWLLRVRHGGRATSAASI